MIENINLFFVFADLIERFMKVESVEASNQIFLPRLQDYQLLFSRYCLLLLCY